MKFIAILTIASLAFGAGWVMRGRKKEIENFEPSNKDQDQSKNMFV